ncbi:outer membrane lipoprotein-sorting protein [Candidatus Dependentiae bacterium]|nr:outer membrane lipoprotein-sorting protein [Candidatus Dependentiae bacterium]
MKRIFKLSLVLICVLTFSFSAVCDEVKVEEIIDKIENLYDIDSSSGILKQTIKTTKNEERAFEILMFSKDGTDKQYMEFLSPSRVKGIKFLYLNDGKDIWTFFPRTGRMRKLASHHKKKKVMGSEFTYEDMTFGNLKEKYTFKLLKEEKFEKEDCWVIEMIPTEKGPSYKKQIMWVRQLDYYPVKIEFYDDELLKTLYQRDIKTVQGIPTAFTIVMITAETKSETKMELIKFKYHVELEDNIFTTQYLKRE